MKKLFTLIAICTAMTVSAQTVEGSKASDNWSIGLDGGIGSNLHEWNTPNGAVAGLQVTKGITPVVSIEFAGQVGINDNANWLMAKSANTLDNVMALASTKVNLMNWFGGYKGTPRIFEIQARGGVGYMRYFNAGADDENLAVAKLGLDFDFNLGKAKAWTVSVRPAVVMKAYNFTTECTNESAYCGKYSHNAVGQLTAGVTYHFKNSNGTHSYKLVKKTCNKALIDSLNAVINAERANCAQKCDQEAKQLAEQKAEIERLRKALADCERRPQPQPQVRSEKGMEIYVHFRQGKSSIDASQQPNVERVVKFLQSHEDAKVAITGYASPEGSKEINDKLATNRANAVKAAIIAKGIAEERIEAQGNGVGDVFSEPDWNRVSICTIAKK